MGYLWRWEDSWHGIFYRDFPSTTSIYACERGSANSGLQFHTEREGVKGLSLKHSTIGLVQDGGAPHNNTKTN